MKSIIIEFGNEANLVNIMTFLVSVGKVPINTEKSIKDYAKYLASDRCDCLIVYDELRQGAYNEYHFCGTSATPTHVWDTDAAKIIDHILNPFKEITINGVGDYSAIVSQDDIRVGCQVISFEKFQEIADAVKEVLGD